MCAQELPTERSLVADERMVQRAETSLSRLIQSEIISEGTVLEAEDALLRLRNRLNEANTRRQTLLKESDKNKEVAAAAEEHDRRVNHDIIETRVREGDMQMIRDSLARDVGRARRMLASLDGIDNPSADSQQQAGSSDWVKFSTQESTLDVEEDDEIVELRQELTEEMSKLKLAEGQLVEVSDEITKVRKKRSELRRKMKDAEQEW